MSTSSEPEWRHSSSCEADASVQIARVGDAVLVRKSTDPDGPVLEFSHAEWVAFEAGVRAGEFGHR